MISFETEARSAHASPIHAVDIVAFVEAQEIPAPYLETPYRLSPVPGGEKLYALLCEELRRSGKIGIAHVVIQAQQHLAVLAPQGRSLMLTTLRCAGAADRAPGGLRLPAGGLLQAADMMLAAPHGGSGIGMLGAAVRQQAFVPGIAALQEDGLDDGALIEWEDDDADVFLEDDELVDERCLSPALRRPRHPADGHALRAKRTRPQRRFSPRGRRP